MTASDHLSPAQFYHGTTHSFEPGQEMTVEGAAPHHHERISQGWLHFTDTPGRAADYAEGRAHDYGGTPRVYQVEPVGEHEHDPGDAWESARSKQPLRVVRELPAHEWDDYGA